MTAMINPLLIQDAVRAALKEDLGLAGDITTLSTIPEKVKSTAHFVARDDGVIAGLALAREAFAQIDADVIFKAKIADGAKVKPKTIIATVSGKARSILSAERVALNFLGRMSGIASLTAKYVEEVKNTKAMIADTRKTTPGLRAFEKYAVRCGGGMNHRYNLDDAVLIKDNHIVAAGGVRQALRVAKTAVGHLIKIEIEVDSLEQLKIVIAEGADVVMLDNMKPDMIRKAVAIVAGKMKIEASGGVNLQTVKAIAEAGPDIISVGALTHSAKVLDIGLDFVKG
jgi:nicotinate-nucleotide pyrophosphorylase (carboxylating)